METGFNWLRVDLEVGFCEHCNVPQKVLNFSEAKRTLSV